MSVSVVDRDYYPSNPRLTIPPHLPTLLKHFTKAAIKTQPKDILSWSASYFKCLVEDEPLPVKERIEMPPEERVVSLGQLRILNNQLKRKDFVSLVELKKRCQVLAVDSDFIENIIEIGCFKNKVQWETFLCVVCAQIAKSRLEAMTLFSAVVTEESEGGQALIPARKLLRALAIVLGPSHNLWTQLLDHLAICSSVCVTFPNTTFIDNCYLKTLSRKLQNGMLHPGCTLAHDLHNINKNAVWHAKVLLYTITC